MKWWPTDHLTPSFPYWSAFTPLVSSCGRPGPCNMSAARTPLATAACCWRRAACSSWSRLIPTHRPTKMSSCWPRAFWRTCSTTEPALASLRQHRQVAACRHNNLTEKIRLPGHKLGPTTDGTLYVCTLDQEPLEVNVKRTKTTQFFAHTLTLFIFFVFYQNKNSSVCANLVIYKM